MTRIYVLGTLVTVGVLSLTVSAFQAPQAAARAVTAVQVRDNLYMLTGGGGNTTVFIGTDGVVVVDAKNPGWGQPILDKIKELTPKPVTMIINTHSHLDHAGGNGEFPGTVDVVAHENTLVNLKDIKSVTGLPPLAPDVANVFVRNNGKNLPKRTFKDRLTVGTGSDRIDLYYFGRGHTNGDAWVVFPALQVLAAGDMFPWRQPPIADANNGGSGVEYPDTLMKAHSTIANVNTIIMGHTPTTSTWADLKEYEEYVRDFVSYAQAQMKAGQSVDEASAGYKVPERFKGYTAPEARVRATIQVIYDELRR